MNRALAVHSSRKSWYQGDRFLILAAFFIDKTVRGCRSCDGSRQAGSSTAIESFWRCIFVELWVFFWSIRGHWRSLGVQGASLGGLMDVPGGLSAAPGGPRGVPGVREACPGDPRDPRGLQGCAGHPWDPFHKDDSVISFRNMSP